MCCPKCDSNRIVMNGINATGKQNHRCQDCGRQFVVEPLKQPISDEKKDLIDRLLLERISLAGIARSIPISESWLQAYVNQKYQEVPQELNPPAPSRVRLVIECDEMWSFVAKKHNKQWIWIAKDRETGLVVGLYIGTRGREGAQGLWDSLPVVYQERAICYTDFWESYDCIFPEERHHSVGKESGKTNHIERFNCTVRQRVSRLVRKALSFSKKIENHVGAIWYFVHHYNDTLLLKASV